MIYLNFLGVVACQISPGSAAACCCSMVVKKQFMERGDFGSLAPAGCGSFHAQNKSPGAFASQLPKGCWNVVSVIISAFRNKRRLGTVFSVSVGSLRQEQDARTICFDNKVSSIFYPFYMSWTR